MKSISNLFENPIRRGQNKGDGEKSLEGGYAVKIEREVEEAKEEHQKPGTRRKNQHLRYGHVVISS
jgi:hypothetical protein